MSEESKNWDSSEWSNVSELKEKAIDNINTTTSNPRKRNKNIITTGWAAQQH